MIRAFLGLAVPAEVRGALQVQQFLLPLPRKVEPADLHVTLVFLGDCPESVLETVHQVCLACVRQASHCQYKGLVCSERRARMPPGPR